MRGTLFALRTWKLLVLSFCGQNWPDSEAGTSSQHRHFQETVRERGRGPRHVVNSGVVHSLSAAYVKYERTSSTRQPFPKTTLLA
jgi:hypothetical protein